MSNILETVSISRQNAALRTFNPAAVISEYLSRLSAREKEILVGRWGLESGQTQTLEEIGKKLNLTRERVRQIEKEGLKKLSDSALPPSFAAGADLIFQIIEEHGNAVREDLILEIVLSGRDSAVDEQGIIFILNLLPRFVEFKETSEYYKAWTTAAFDRPLFDKIAAAAEEILKKAGRPLTKQELLEALQVSLDPEEFLALPAEAVASYLTISKKIDRNPFGEWGLVFWPQIRPKDVGDKAFLVLSHGKQPEHYVKITELINKNKFDDRIAQKETVHNELIKDNRFVLVGRGIYALSSWGYKPGVVADIIEEILKKTQKPLSRSEIISQVLEQRLVKKNTIIVGLSNKQRFKKTPENKFILADNA